MKKIILIAIILFTTLLCYSTNKEILILLEEENPELIEKLKKKNQLEEMEKYQNDIKNYNILIQEMFKNNFTEIPISFILFNELAIKTNEELLNYHILTSSFATINKVNLYNFYLNTVSKTTSKKEKVEFNLYSKSFDVCIDNSIPNKADFLYLITQLKIYFKLDKNLSVEERKNIIKEKTLYVDKDLTKLTLSEVKEKYNYPVKLVSHQEIEKLASNQDENSLYIRLRTTNDIVYLMIVDCLTAKYINESPVSGLTKVSFNSPSANSMNNREFFRTGKVNNIYGIGMVGTEMFRIYTKNVKISKLNFKLFAKIE